MGREKNGKKKKRERKSPARRKVKGLLSKFSA